jgi:hypothetical protein
MSDEEYDNLYEENHDEYGDFTPTIKVTSGRIDSSLAGAEPVKKVESNAEREQASDPLHPLKQHIGAEKFNDLHNGKAVEFHFNDPRTNEEVSATIKRDMVYGIPTYILNGNGAKRRVDEKNIIDMFERGEYRNEPTAGREQAKQPKISAELDSLSVKPKSTFINIVMGSLSEKTDGEKQELFNALGLKKGVSADEFKQAAGKHWDSLRDVRMSKKSDRNENLAAIKRQKQEIAMNKDIYNQTGRVPDPIDISLPHPDKQPTPEAKPK